MILVKVLKAVCPCFFRVNRNKGMEQKQQQEGKLTSSIGSGSTNKFSEHETQSNQKMEQNIIDTTQLGNKQSNQLQQHEEDSLLKEEEIQQCDYTQYLEKGHPFKNLLIDKLQKLNNIFDIPHEGEPIKPPTEYNLQLKLTKSEDLKTTIFSYSFQFPTSFAQYDEMMNQYELQKHFDQNIDEYQCLEQVDEQTRVIYLSYKRVVIIAPRDFVYIRYCFIHDDEHWIVATSVPDAQPKQGKCRGDIVLTATRVIPTKTGIKVNVYSRVDMKISIKGDMAKNRGVQQIKKYLDKSYQHLLQKGKSPLDNNVLDL